MSTTNQNAAWFNSDSQFRLRATHETNQGNGQIRSPKNGSVGAGVYGVYYVDTIKVDEVVKKEDVVLMKIDVEGYEGAVLDGMWGLRCGGKVRFIIIEFSEET